MNIFKRVIADGLLIGVLFSLLFLPFGAVSLSGVREQQTEVLSETTVRKPTPSPTQYKYDFEDPAYIESALQSTFSAEEVVNEDELPSEGQEVDNGQY